jgi:hypothetical protein
MIQYPNQTANGETIAQGCLAQAKWAALIDDIVVPMPQRLVEVHVLRSQANVAENLALVRDHNSPEDVVFDDDQSIDLADGNVFYRVPRCDLSPRGKCRVPAKLAFFVDDHPELTTNPKQTGKSVRALFSLAQHAILVRDFESPNDVAIAPESDVLFEAGPVFVTRQVEVGLTIIVNGRRHEVAKRELTFDEIVALAFDNPPEGENICFTVTYRGGDCTKPEGTLLDGESARIKCGMIFNVTATDKS